MLSRLTDFDRTFELLDEFRRQMDHVWDDLDDRWGGRVSAPKALAFSGVPAVNVSDAGASLVVRADVPGLGEKDFEVTLHDGVLSIRGERKVEAPEGYVAHRRERASLRFARSLALPVKVDAEKTTAQVKDGVLTITLAKAPEAKPRQIAVRSQA